MQGSHGRVGGSPHEHRVLTSILHPQRGVASVAPELHSDPSCAGLGMRKQWDSHRGVFSPPLGHQNHTFGQRNNLHLTLLSKIPGDNNLSYCSF